MKRLVMVLLGAICVFFAGLGVGVATAYRSSERLLSINESTGELVQELRCAGRTWHTETLPLNFLMAVAPGELHEEAKLSPVSLRAADGSSESWNRGGDFVSLSSDLGALHLVSDNALSLLKMDLGKLFSNYTPDAVQALRHDYYKKFMRDAGPAILPADTPPPR